MELTLPETMQACQARVARAGDEHVRAFAGGPGRLWKSGRSAVGSRDTGNAGRKKKMTRV